MFKVTSESWETGSSTVGASDSTRVSWILDVWQRDGLFSASKLAVASLQFSGVGRIAPVGVDWFKISICGAIDQGMEGRTEISLDLVKIR